MEERTGPAEAADEDEAPVVDAVPTDPEAEADAAGPGPLTARRVAVLAGAWVAVLVVATLVVAYPLGPILQRREQHEQLQSFRVELSHAANATEGLAGLLETTVPSAPHAGDPVAILDVGGDLRLRQVVVEGVDAGQTWKGPGHVPGTAGLGQPGNAVVVGRRAGWGGPFAHLAQLERGDDIITSTTQGQSVYRVATVGEHRAGDNDYAPSDDDRLTLVTSASGSPLASRRSIVVVAKLVGQPFAPTAQGARDTEAQGRTGDRSVVPQLGFFLLLFAGVVAASVLAQRRWKPLVAYVLTTPLLVVLMVLVAESASRLLPAWS